MMSPLSICFTIAPDTVQSAQRPLEIFSCIHDEVSNTESSGLACGCAYNSCS